MNVYVALAVAVCVTCVNAHADSIHRVASHGTRHATISRVRHALNHISSRAGSVTGHDTRRASSSNVGDQLRFLISEETAQRNKLEARIQAIRAEARKINNAITPCTNCPTTFTPKRDPSIAYTGTLPAYTSSLKTTTVLNYTSDLINIGTPFNVTSAHFVANVSGLYGFSMTVFMQPSYWTDLELVKNGSPFLYARTGHYKSGSTNRQVNMGTNFAIVRLNATDEVWPRYKSSSSSNLYADGVTTFTGVLLHEM